MQSKGSRPLSVLVVDDEAAIRDLVIQILELKYHVYSATNTAEALRIAKEHKPCLALIDIYMPGRNGLDLCKELRSDPVTRHIPIMIMTARNALETRVKAFENGADDFIEKPFYMDELISRVDAKISRFSESHSSSVKKDFKAGSLVTRKNIEEYIWGKDIPTTRPLDTHIAGLRRKLAASKRLKLRTVYGEGFVLEPVNNI